mmetsp:Transcript_15479/g.49388  ORF Transcript_15479/g.49388 Transcript_15479/m.49388 type:complete len:207 (+) Transcript_15479:1577-2197(+)
MASACSARWASGPPQGPPSPASATRSMIVSRSPRRRTQKSTGATSGPATSRSTRSRSCARDRTPFISRRAMCIGRLSRRPTRRSASRCCRPWAATTRTQCSRATNSSRRRAPLCSRTGRWTRPPPPRTRTATTASSAGGPPRRSSRAAQPSRRRSPPRRLAAPRWPRPSYSRSVSSPRAALSFLAARLPRANPNQTRTPLPFLHVS